MCLHSLSVRTGDLQAALIDLSSAPAFPATQPLPPQSSMRRYRSRKGRRASVLARPSLPIGCERGSCRLPWLAMAPMQFESQGRDWLLKSQSNDLRARPPGSAFRKLFLSNPAPGERLQEITYAPAIIPGLSFRSRCIDNQSPFSSRASLPSSRIVVCAATKLSGLAARSKFCNWDFAA